MKDNYPTVTGEPIHFAKVTHSHTIHAEKRTEGNERDREEN